MGKSCFPAAALVLEAAGWDLLTALRGGLTGRALGGHQGEGQGATMWDRA